MSCIFCNKPADNPLGVRLRKPPRLKAIFAPNLGAFVCRDCAAGGITFEIRMTRRNDGKVETRTTAGGASVVRVTPIDRTKLP